MKDISHLFSEESNRRHPSLLKASHKYNDYPGMRSLGGGMPMTSLFPFDDLSVKSHAVPFERGIEAPIEGSGNLEIHIGKSLESSPEEIPLAKSLQYGGSAGFPPLKDFVTEHTTRVHSIPNDDWDLTMTIGNTFAWDAVLRTFVNPGEPILVEEFTFSSALNAAQAVGAVCVPAKMDLEGLLPEALAAQLEHWVGPKPKLLYTIPTGQNPTGSSLSEERRKKIYDICAKHDMVIIEDEPYYYLQMPPYGEKHEPVSGVDLPKALIKSFLSMDTEGIVVRLESFSKVIAPGTRLGWAVGPKAVISRLLLIIESSQQSPCGFTQSIIYGLLRRWGQEGYLEWLAKIRELYTKKRDHCIDSIKKYLPSDCYEVSPPVAGMFFWLKFDARRFTLFKEFKGDTAKITDALWHAGIDNKVLMAPGHWFKAKGNTSPPQPVLSASDEADEYAIYLRGTYASVTFENMDLAVEALGKTLRERLV